MMIHDVPAPVTGFQHASVCAEAEQWREEEEEEEEEERVVSRAMLDRLGDGATRRWPCEVTALTVWVGGGGGGTRDKHHPHSIVTCTTESPGRAGRAGGHRRSFWFCFCFALVSLASGHAKPRLMITAGVSGLIDQGAGRVF
ncbi:hypothetical protein JZ751_004474 [Albula glossodonta]|uniref:Uncharacterized protein n=1 Tax=Albula glossodonta TaxID=121402 RepID=A0A8T2N842_9TELE|nr:hypothetical protein JZ751_004474 [Albula glossodonta]